MRKQYNNSSGQPHQTEPPSCPTALSAYDNRHTHVKYSQANCVWKRSLYKIRRFSKHDLFSAVNVDSLRCYVDWNKQWSVISAVRWPTRLDPALPLGHFSHCSAVLILIQQRHNITHWGQRKQPSHWARLSCLYAVSAIRLSCMYVQRVVISSPTTTFPHESLNSEDTDDELIAGMEVEENPQLTRAKAWNSGHTILTTSPIWGNVHHVCGLVKRVLLCTPVQRGSYLSWLCIDVQ